MKLNTRNGFLFIGRSMIWSLLLYVAMMVAFNWEDVSRTVLGKNAVTIVSSTLPTPPADSEPVRQPASISAGHVAGSVISSLHTVLRFLPR
jgi:hypothetical protein